MDVRGVVSLLLGSLLLVISACSGGEPREVTDDEEVNWNKSMDNLL